MMKEENILMIIILIYGSMSLLGACIASYTTYKMKNQKNCNHEYVKVINNDEDRHTYGEYVIKCRKCGHI